MRVLSTGTIMVDVLAVGLPAIAEPGRVVYTPHEIETRIGGHPIDVAIDLAKLGVDPSQVAVAAAIGEGPYGRFVRDVIDEHGVATFVQSVADRDTGKNVVLSVTGEDRRFHIDPGANWLLDPDHVIDTLRSWRPDILTLRPGYSGIDLHLEAVLAAAADALVLLDIMQPHPSRPADYLDAALSHADIVHCNEIEAVVATSASSAEEAVGRFLDQGVGLVLMTSGEHGVTAYTRTAALRQSGFVVDVVDATGCGDAFCAGVVQWLMTTGRRVIPEELEVGDLAGLLMHAQAVGASAATRAGCVEGVTAATVDRLFAEQGTTVLSGTESTRTPQPGKDT